MELRFALLSGHYRQPLNFTWQTLAAGRAALARIARLLARHSGAAEPAFAPGRALDYGPFAPAAAALTDDLNTPRALGEMFVALDALERASPDVQAAGVPGLRALLLTLGLTPPPVPSHAVEIAAPAEVRALAEARLAARARRDWAEADVLRQRLTAAGWTVRDTADGFALAPAPKPVSASSSVSANSAPSAP
jgi:cysteinyl-tRNA synthetase